MPIRPPALVILALFIVGVGPAVAAELAGDVQADDYWVISLTGTNATLSVDALLDNVLDDLADDILDVFHTTTSDSPSSSSGPARRPRRGECGGSSSGSIRCRSGGCGRCGERPSRFCAIRNIKVGPPGGARPRRPRRHAAGGSAP